MSFAQTYAGLRVLDLSENIAGPLACMILADLGADVIKVERPTVGEATRSLPPRWPAEDGGEATVFLGFNRNKRSLAVDLRRPEARDAVLRIGQGVDVVVESLRPGVATRLGLDFDAFAAGNDRLVHCSVSAFGTGPIGHDRAGYDALIQAYSGILEATGEPDGGPSRAAPSIIDMTTGMWAALSIQAALKRRETPGSPPGPQQLEATLVDTGLFLMTHQIMGYLGSGTFPGRLGAAAPSAAPYNVWPTADAPIMIATSTDRTYRTLCDVLGTPELADDERFAAMADRLARRDELDALIGEQLRTRKAQDWLDALWAAGVPAGPVHDLAAALADPLTKERALLAPAEPGRIPDLQQLHLPMDGGREALLRQPPAVGEHTGAVLAEAGFSPEEIAAITEERPR
ncbi:CoA transferase [Sporichthya sp.]|uniref:CaiB/BaiF CoA transferase family protein n=1 Tax=Sporichthya sp. TaxID=65475 RepID=UPI001834D995|nr:CoA transferase [Sporichthya sp.]MBA3742658.1 CoA transferase [Sporichthya sp.]